MVRLQNSEKARFYTNSGFYPTVQRLNQPALGERQYPAAGGSPRAALVCAQKRQPRTVAREQLARKITCALAVYAVAQENREKFSMEKNRRSLNEQLFSWPVVNIDDRPREKLLVKGAAVFFHAELLPVFLRHGVNSKSAGDLARELLSRYGSGLAFLGADEGGARGTAGSGVLSFAERGLI